MAHTLAQPIELDEMDTLRAEMASLRDEMSRLRAFVLEIIACGGEPVQVAQVQARLRPAERAALAWHRPQDVA